MRGKEATAAGSLQNRSWLTMFSVISLIYEILKSPNAGLDSSLKLWTKNVQSTWGLGLKYRMQAQGSARSLSPSPICMVADEPRHRQEATFVPGPALHRGDSHSSF